MTRVALLAGLAPAVADATASRLAAAGLHPLTAAADAHAAVLAALERGSLDVAVCGTGPHPTAPFHEPTGEEPPVTAAALRAVVPAMRRLAEAELADGEARPRRIVLLAPAAFASGTPGESAAAAAGGAAVGLARTLARELGPHHITVNTVLAGNLDPGPQDGVAEAVRQLTRALTAVGRLGTAADVAAVIAFLASADAAFVTGAVIPVTGGQLGALA